MMNPFALSNHVYKEMDDKRKCFRWIWSDETVWFQLHNEFIHGGECRRKDQNITIVVSDWYTQTVLMILPALPHPGWFCTWPSSHPFTACITFLPHRQAPCDPTTSPLTDSHLCFCAACCPQDCVAPFLCLQVSAQMASYHRGIPALPHIRSAPSLLYFPLQHFHQTHYIFFTDWPSSNKDVNSTNTGTFVCLVHW